MNEAKPTLSGFRIIESLAQAHVTHVVSVPDLTTSEGVLRPLARQPAPRLVRICREEEGVGICAGLHVGGQRGVMLIQYTGLLASMNAIRAVAMEYSQPICMLVGMLFTDSPDDICNSQNYGVRKTIPILDALGMAYYTVATDADVDTIPMAINAAFRDSKPVALLITRYPEATP
ncbi:MAG: decarboxylase [Pseudomonadota bacterium]